MQSTRNRFIGVALLVCLFATGMATFLNYYKYKSTLTQLLQTRMLVIGYGVENSIQSSLELGLAFDELTTLPALLARERLADKLITGIDVFDAKGKVLYSTDSARTGKPVPPAWAEAIKVISSREARGVAPPAPDKLVVAGTPPSQLREWSVREQDEIVSGISLKNNFDLTVGYLAMRYTRTFLDQNVAEMGLRLVLIGVLVLICSIAAVGMLLAFLLGRYERDMAAIAERIAGTGDAAAVPEAFGPAVEDLRDSLADAETGLARVRARLAEPV